MRRAVLIYDGRCGFCRAAIRRWRRATGRRVRYLPYQRPAVRWRYGVSKRAAASAVQLIEPGGRRSSGATAMLRILLRATSPGVRWAARLALLPGLKSLAGLLYRAVARNRRRLGWLGRLLDPALNRGPDEGERRRPAARRRSRPHALARPVA